MNEKLTGMLLSLLIILKVFGSTEAACSITGSTAYCRNQGLTSVPQNLPTGIIYLDLGNNLITTLNQSDFSQYGSLQELWLYNNEISDIQAGTFNSTPQLRELYLYQNNLTNLRSDMFTGLGNLETLWLHNNEISDIQAGTFNSTPQLRDLWLSQNKLTNIRSDMFTGLGNLQFLYLHDNEISDIQAGTFNSKPQLWSLRLEHNRLTVLKAEMFAKLSSIQYVSIYNNPWQCDCRMVPFRQMMTGSHYFENQITCKGPSNFHGQKLKDISPEDLTCEKPTILRFGRSDNNTVVEGQTLHLVCEASGIPTPDITVILPSGLNATVESAGGRVTVGVNGTIAITNVTADSGLYVCTAKNVVGSSSATLSVVQPRSTDTLSLSVLVGSVCAAVFGIAILVTIILTIWHKSGSNSDEEEYEDVIPLSQRPHTGNVTDHRWRVGRFEHKYEVIPPSLPPRNWSSPVTDNQNVSAAVHGADSPQGVMDEKVYDSVKDDPQSDKYENSQVIAAAKDALSVPAVILYKNDDESVIGKDDLQSHKYENSQVIAAAKDALSVPAVILYENDEERVTRKDDPLSNKYQNSLVIATAQNAWPVPPVILYENDDESVIGNDDLQSNKYENSQVIAAAKDALAVPSIILYENDEERVTRKDDHQSHKYQNRQVKAATQDSLVGPPATVIFYENNACVSFSVSVTRKDNPLSNKYQNSQVIAAAKDAAAVPQVILYENDDETADNQTRVDCQNGPAAVHGADTPNRYQELRKETLEPHHDYTSLLPQDS
ncbi:uncharacterized protein [Branchiostoma lanceolatum]|uniref:uncharacterized protein n=1 Tax=Branchiostoma lanceolatum TaxID=7740 RepID=UPI003454055A